MSKEQVTVNGKNYFNEECFEKACHELEQGKEVSIYIDCIGHTRNNYEQENYKDALLDTYGERLVVTCTEGVCSYHYNYYLKD